MSKFATYDKKLIFASIMKSSKVLGWIAVLAAVILFCIHWYIRLFTDLHSEIEWWQMLLPFGIGATFIIFPHDMLVGKISKFWHAVISRIHKDK